MRARDRSGGARPLSTAGVHNGGGARTAGAGGVLVAAQATINIGTIGHVAHGKSTVVKAITGVQTVRFKNELERNITIKLG